MAKRKIAQIISALLYNANLKGFFEGKIYQGKLKSYCVPGLNCYSCPGSLGACPIGSLQAVLGSLGQRISLYVAGFLIVTGALFGRFICGWVCPFGLLQELLYKIPLGKIKAKRAFAKLKYLKYLILLVFVIALPIILLNINGVSAPTFCEFICPAGTLEAGIPLVLLNDNLQSAIGWLFSWKAFLLILFIVFSVVIYRPFCRFVCPLGAIYALFNRISVFGIKLDKSSCTNCGSCSRACKLDIKPNETPNSAECIRCGDCIRACPTGSLKYKGKADISASGGFRGVKTAVRIDDIRH